MSTGSTPNKPGRVRRQRDRGDSEPAKPSRKPKPASGGRLLVVLSAIAVLLFLVVVAIPRDRSAFVVVTPEYPSEFPPAGDQPVERAPQQPEPELHRPRPDDAARRPSPAVRPERAPEQPAPAVPPPSAALPVPPRRGTLYLVIDDAGYSLDDLDRFLEFPHPLTIAVLPHLPRSMESALSSVRAGKEVILHMPMEADNGADPGPGAIMVSHDEAQIRRRIHEALVSVPGATGANNHMGSRATADRRVMDVVVSELVGRGLFFYGQSDVGADRSATRGDGGGYPVYGATCVFRQRT